MKNAIILQIMILLLGCSQQQKQPADMHSSNNSVTPAVNEQRLEINQPSERVLKEDFNNFWASFRKAILSNDTTQLLTLCTFPLKYKGPTDDDPVKKISEQDFSRIFSLFLKQWDGLDLNGSTEFDYIKKTSNPGTQSEKAQIRMGDMVFYFTAGKWKLGLLYLQEETVANINSKPALK